MGAGVSVELDGAAVRDELWLERAPPLRAVCVCPRLADAERWAPLRARDDLRASL